MIYVKRPDASLVFVNRELPEGFADKDLIAMAKLEVMKQKTEGFIPLVPAIVLHKNGKVLCKTVPSLSALIGRPATGDTLLGALKSALIMEGISFSKLRSFCLEGLISTRENDCFILLSAQLNQDYIPGKEQSLIAFDSATLYALFLMGT